MAYTESKIENRHLGGGVFATYRVTFEIVENVPAADLLVGDEVWELEAWSSNGMKAGFWQPVTDDAVKAYFAESDDSFRVRRVVSKARVY